MQQKTDDEILELLEKRRKYKHTWYETHKELTKSRSKEWGKTHAEQRKVSQKRYKMSHADKIKEYNRQYRAFSDYAKVYHDNHVHRGWARGTIRSHKNRGNEIEITIDELEKIALNTSRCLICDIEFEWGWHKGVRLIRPTLDRINNGDTINKDNIMIICGRCNGTKLDRSLSEFIEYCDMVAKKFRRQ